MKHSMRPHITLYIDSGCVSIPDIHGRQHFLVPGSNELASECLRIDRQQLPQQVHARLASQHLGTYCSHAGHPEDPLNDECLTFGNT
eukprot:5019785-Amphidinium_carterae.1